MTLSIWTALLVLSLFLVRGKRPMTFAPAFALACALFLWGRPVSWTLPYADIVVLGALWPALKTNRQRGAFLGGAILLAGSHWMALIRTALGVDMSLLTLQSSAFPWETVVVLPLALTAALFACLASRTVP